MTSIQTLDSATYELAKKQALSVELIRKEIHLSEFKVVHGNAIEVSGKPITVSSRAFNKILTRLRIPTAFAKRFAEGFGEDGLSRLVEMIKSAKSSNRDQTVTLVVNPQTKSIVDILPQGYANISNESFFNFIENYIDKFNLSVNHFGYDILGGVTINTSAPNAIFQIPDLKTETYKTGVTFSNTPSRGLQVRPFLNRLICANGLTSSLFSENFGLHSLEQNKIDEFNEHMHYLSQIGFQPIGVAERIKAAQQIQASLFELEKAASSLASAKESVDWDYIQRYTPIAKSLKVWEMAGFDRESLTNTQLKTAKSGISIWDVVNGMTNFSSNDTRYNLTDWQRSRIMEDAGNLLMKRQWDTQSQLPVDPFADRQLLQPEELTILRGDN